MASKFWAQDSGGSGSDSDSDSDSDSSMGAGAPGAGARRQWAVDSDSESEEEVRVVKSAKDRSFEAIRNSVSRIRNHIKINDWNGIQTDFDECNKHVDKAKALITKEGVPSFYIKLLANLEDLLTATLKDKAAVKKMSATNTRSLNRMKLQLRKHNKNYEKELADYRTNPASYIEESEESESDEDESDSESESSESDSDDESEEDSEDDESDDSDSDEDSSDAEDTNTKKPIKPIKPQKNLEDLDSDEWSSDSESDSDSDGSEDEGDTLKGRAKWVKKTDDTSDKKKKQKEERRAAKAEEGKKGRKEKAAVVVGKDKGPPLKMDLDMTSEELEKKLRECLASRGRKATDPKDVLRQLSVLAYVARRMGPIREIPIIMYLVSAMFDTLRNIDEYMEISMWKSCRGYINRVTDLLEARPELKLGQAGNELVADLIQVNTAQVDETDMANQMAEVEATGVLKVVGSLSSYMMRLGEEYTKSLQSINPHTQEYIKRLKDESVVVELAAKVQGYYERHGDTSVAADLALLQAEHLYYQHQSIASAVHRAQSFTNVWGKAEDLHPSCTVSSASTAASEGVRDVTKIHPGAFLGRPTVDHEKVDYSEQLRQLCVTVYQHGGDRARTRAMLCHITHHALHDRFYPARDLLLMSHLQDNISQADIATQILYNRMMVTLGLCAFRGGMITEAHDCLRDVCSSRVKELLAQGIQMNRFQDKNPEQEKAERRRQTPYHMHINLDLLECCHLTSAMLLEVPNMAQESTELRRRVLSKHFRRYVDIFNRQVFTGPPENIRDHVIAASKRLMEGDWRRCCDLILGLDVWNLIPGEGKGEKVKEMVRGKIQAEALRTYLFTFSAHYESLSLPTLCEMFAMEKGKVHSIISRMMLNQELYGSWDQPTETVVLRKEDPNTLQMLALKFADKAANLVESNERLIDARTGGYGYRDDGGRGVGRGRGRSDWGGGRGGSTRDTGGRGGGDWGSSRGYHRPGQTTSNRYQGSGRSNYDGRGAGNYIRERRDMGVGPRR